MANGLLATAKPSSETNTILYTGSAGQLASGSLAICRQGAGSELVRVALIDSANVGDLTDENYVVYNSDAIQITGLVVGPNQSIVVYANADSVSFVFWGFEESE